VNGIGQTGAALVRTIGPALGGSLWAWSCSNGIEFFPLNHYFVFFLIVLIDLVLLLQSIFMLSNDLNTGMQ
jgi:hypothetical protein